jgi:hypothetical protein
MGSYPLLPLNLFSAGLPGLGPYGYSAGVQLSPQGFFGDLLGRVGSPVGSLLGSAFGNQGLGQQLGVAAGQLGSFLPFAAGPGGLQQAGATAQQQPANIEAQVMSDFMQDAASNAIRKLYDYVNANSQKFSQLSGVTVTLGQAVESYRTRDYASAFSQAYQTHRSICLLRTVVPDLPALPVPQQTNPQQTGT